MKLKDKTVLITGAARGIGRALAVRFANEGARVAVADLDGEGAREVAAGIDGVGLEIDVSRKVEVQRAVEVARYHFGPIDLLCSNAGVMFTDAPGWTATSQDDEQWERLWKVNVMAHVWGARAVLPEMVQRGSGYLLHTVSAAGLLSQIGDAGYSTTKHAAIGFAESLAITHGEQGIGVSVLCPQAVETQILAGKMDQPPAKAAMADGVISPEEVADATVRGLEAESFLILPHPQVASYMAGKGKDYDRWLQAMRRFRRSLWADDSMMEWST